MRKLSPLVAEHVELAQIRKAMPKVVFSTTLESVVGNTGLATELRSADPGSRT